VARKEHALDTAADHEMNALLTHFVEESERCHAGSQGEILASATEGLAEPGGLR
jgi:hypothetical protein